MPDRGRQAKDLLQYAAVRGGDLLARALPERLVSAGLARALEVVGRRRLVLRSLEHLDLAFGDTLSSGEKRGIVDRMVRHLARAVVETARLLKEGPTYALRRVEADSTRARLDAVLARGRGAIVLTAHFGNFELLSPWFGQSGYRLATIRARLVNRRFDALVSRLYRRANVTLVYQDEFPRRILAALAAGEMVGTVPDQDIARLAGTFVPFFGRPAYTPIGPAALARLSGAPLVPHFLEWTGEGYRLTFEEPIEVPRTPDRDADLVAGTRAWSAVVEARIRRRPDHWVWFHPRWKTTPERLRRRGRAHLLLSSPAGV